MWLVTTIEQCRSKGCTGYLLVSSEIIKNITPPSLSSNVYVLGLWLISERLEDDHFCICLKAIIEGVSYFTLSLKDS